MSIEFNVINFLKENPEQTTRQIAIALNVPRYRVVLTVAKLLWQQRIELAGYKNENADGQRHPTYNSIKYRGVTIQ